MTCNSTDEDLLIMISVTKFGQKQEEPVILDFLDLKHVTSMSIHAACTITAKDPRVHILWSRYEMHEAVNFQSNLDNKGMDVKQSLLSLFCANKLNFIQLYVVSPLVHLQMPHKHPVSGVIAMCGLAHHQTHKSMVSRALAYLTHINNLKSKLVGQLKSRIEQVVYLGEGDILPKVIKPKEYFCEEKLDELLATKPMVLPFIEDENSGPMNTLSLTMEYLTVMLWKVFQNNSGMGGYTASWTAYQIELTLEEMVYGHPLSPLDYHYTVSLGTCSG